MLQAGVVTLNFEKVEFSEGGDLAAAAAAAAAALTNKLRICRLLTDKIKHRNQVQEYDNEEGSLILDP